MWGVVLYLLSYIGLSPIPWIAYLIGTTEPALNLLVSILMGYPLAVFYHQHVRQTSMKDFYFILTGLDMAFFNFGLTLYHNIMPILFLYVLTKVMRPGPVFASISFVFNMGYLLSGYIMTESEDYDITWTMPHCVLTLKLIALSFDLWDGEKLKAKEMLSSNQAKSALTEAPSLVQLLAFVYFPACFLVGPIFSFRRYLDFTHPDKYPLTGRDYQDKALKKFLIGLLYLSAFQVGVTIFSMKHIQSEEFWDMGVFSRHMYCGMWAHFALYKYIACWLLTEAACIRIGLSFNGYETDSNRLPVAKWDGCNNIKLKKFELATKFQHYIDSFNCNTNHFAAEYIYKRLKFLGNRHLSQFFTLLFLALWHGTQSGYFMTFLNEFLIIFMEKELESMLMKTRIYEKAWSNRLSSWALYLILKLYTIVFMGWSLVPFDVKVFDKWFNIYYKLYFSGFILFVPWAFVYKPLLKKYLRTKRE